MAVVDYFLKFDGIKGESTDAKHKDEINIESWSWGETLVGAGDPPGGGGGGAGKVQTQDFHFVMHLNRASPVLMKACATGQHIKTATLTGRKAGKGQQDFLTFKFSDVLVGSYSTSGSEQSGVAVPSDGVSLSFAKIEVEYKPQNPDGSLGTAVSFRFDFKANKPF